jgi:rfaE bifunctional protein kinase chain/domain
VLISGNFNVIHAGHIRLFALGRELGTKLIVGVYSDRSAGGGAFIDESFRVEALRASGWADQVILIDKPLEAFIRELRPDIVVKGREFEHKDNVEAAVLSEYGGQLIFGSSELPLSVMNMMRSEISSPNLMLADLSKPYIRRHKIDSGQIEQTLQKFQQLKVCVFGDVIVDEYIACEALGMSQEDPSLVVTPVDRKQFLGGSGIVAAHAASLGASTVLMTVLGNDETGEFAASMLNRQGVELRHVVDAGRPTTLKQRFRADDTTLLRVSKLHQNSISLDLQKKLLAIFKDAISGCDLLILSDFNYGCLPQELAGKCISIALSNGTVVAVDSQSSSQVGEARIGLRDKDSGLARIAEKLRTATECDNIILKLGADGIIVHSKSPEGIITTSNLAALNPQAVDVAGAGDSMLAATGMALAAGASHWVAALLGSAAASMQVSRMGNVPIQASDFFGALENLERSM